MWRSTPSAVGLLQMLPRQKKSTRRDSGFKPNNARLLPLPHSIRAQRRRRAGLRRRCIRILDIPGYKASNLKTRCLKTLSHQYKSAKWGNTYEEQNCTVFAWSDLVRDCHRSGATIGWNCGEVCGRIRRAVDAIGKNKQS